MVAPPEDVERLDGDEGVVLGLAAVAAGHLPGLVELPVAEHRIGVGVEATRPALGLREVVDVAVGPADRPVDVGPPVAVGSAVGTLAVDGEVRGARSATRDGLLCASPDNGDAMPSETRLDALAARVLTQRNAVIATAIAVAIPAAYAFYTLFGDGSGDFLLLMTLAVGVPTAYDGYWPQYDRAWKAVAWTLAACAVAGIEFAGLYVLGHVELRRSPFVAAVGAFLATWGLNLGWLVLRRR
ncbi:hypothetical protein [Haloarcula litorea]|uniref:hypothetical protein n=1 Tax=Haloarcula litorea TaxID=3032579 RepID=UPI0023E82926|nr:hypothetical protein [Halomicroarcula sp. GDY20]